MYYFQVTSLKLGENKVVKLLEEDILTKEVLTWKGMHLFHFALSSCSQKTRIVLNLKNLSWKSHPVNLYKKEHFTPRYLGINPRGLVPTLVDDGSVYIESNDIIQLIDSKSSESILIPEGMENKVAELLNFEDDLHLDLRTITFRFTQNRGKAPRSPSDLKNYRDGGSGMVKGIKDKNKEREITFWETVAETGITNEAVRTSAKKFKEALDVIDENLANSKYILSGKISLLDVAWFIYVNRLNLCGYPIESLHPNVFKWFKSLASQSEFSNEIKIPTEVKQSIDHHHEFLSQERSTLIDIAEILQK